MGLEKFAPAGAEVTVFDIGKRMIDTPPHMNDGKMTRETIAAIYSRLRGEFGKGFPPPKSHFGQSPTKYLVDSKPRLWKSEHFGGLTNFWGGGMLPFTDREFEEWPVTAAEMDPYYRIVGEHLGVCGESDRLNDYFSVDYVNRPPLKTSHVVEKLRDTINAHSEAPRHGVAYSMIAGASRLALETRQDRSSACAYTGECMLGCTRDAIWSSAREIARLRANGTVSVFVRGKVLEIRQRHIRFCPDSESVVETKGPYDRIFIAAGCIGSTEIAMRTFGISQGPEMVDTAVQSFPLFYFGAAGGLRGDDDKYFALSNLAVMGIPDIGSSLNAVQVSVYPAFDHLWRFYTPRIFWPVMSRLWKLGRWRLMLGRAYFDGGADRKLAFELSDDRLVIRQGAEPRDTRIAKTFMRSLRGATNHAGFYVPPITPIGHGTSSHYGCTLPYNGGWLNVTRSGRVETGIYLADAATFPKMPAISPTFTIVANACRTVYEALQD